MTYEEADFGDLLRRAGALCGSDAEAWERFVGGLPVTTVSASRGKAARAEPIAARFEQGKAKLAGRFPELEDELAGLLAAGGYEGPGRSPDRADAMTWALTELARPRAEPRLRCF